MESAVPGALAGKVAIVTGAATGIGRASAVLFARAGAGVVLADVRQDELGAGVAEVRRAAGEGTAVAVVADLATPEDCAAVVAAAIDAYGGIPMGRLGEPEDVARCALFLASDDSSFMSGIQVVVDGGAAATAI